MAPTQDLSASSILEILRSEKLMEDFQEVELLEILSFCEVLSFPTGVLVIEENEQSNDLYIILDGEVILFKTEKESLRQFPIGKLGKGEIFGEMSFLDDSLRSTSVKANSELTVLKLPKEKFESAPPKLRDIYSRLTRNTAKIVIQRLRNTNEGVLRRRRKESRDRIALSELGKNAISFILWLQVIGGISYLLYDAGIKGDNFYIVNALAFLAMLIPTSRFVKTYQYPLNQLGLTFNGWQKSFLKSFFFAGLLALLAAIATFQSEFNVSPSNISPNTLSWPFLLTLPLYAFVAEFILRGVMQTIIQKLMSTSSSWSGIFYNAIAVAATNFYFGPTAVAIAFALNLILGYIYLSERNLIAVTFIHLAALILLKITNLLPLSNFI